MPAVVDRSVVAAVSGFPVVTTTVVKGDKGPGLAVVGSANATKYQICK